MAAKPAICGYALGISWSSQGLAAYVNPRSFTSVNYGCVTCTYPTCNSAGK